MKLSDLKQGEYKVAQDQSPSRVMGIVNAFGNFGIGLGSTLINDLTKLGSIPLKGASYLAEKTGSETLKKAFPKTTDKSIVSTPEIQQRAETGFGQTGQIAGTLSEFLIPTGAITRGSKILGGIAEKAPVGFKYLSQLLARAAPEAAADFGIEYGRTGGDVESAISTAKWGAGTVGVLNILGDTVKATYWPELKESISKALGLSGKGDAGRVLPDLEKKVSGFATLKEMAPKTQITGLDGVSKIFNPAKASYFDTVQALSSNKKAIYDEYTALAKKAGDKATIDLSDVLSDLDAVLNQARTSDYKSAAQKIMADIYSNFAVKLPDGSITVKEADIPKLQTFLQDLNNGAASTLAGKSDKAYGEIAADTAGRIRELMDQTITAQTGTEYQALRTKYASLKSIEDDLVKRFKQEARRIGGGLTDYVYLLNTPEIISSMMTLNPATFAGAIGTGVLATLRKYLANPERYLQRSFDLVDSKGASDLSIRLFGGRNNTPLTDSEKQMIEKLKNQRGIEIKAANTPNTTPPITTPAATSKINISDSIQDTIKKSNSVIPFIGGSAISEITKNKAKELGYGEADETELRAIQDEEDIKQNKIPSNDEVKRQIAWRESRGEQNPYTAVNERNKNGTKDYGKYQINETTLNHWSEKYLGKKVTPDEFLRSPELQEKFMDKTIEHLKEIGVKKLDSLLILHHKGYGDISSKRINELKEKYKDYLDENPE